MADSSCLLYLHNRYHWVMIIIQAASSRNRAVDKPATVDEDTILQDSHVLVTNIIFLFIAIVIQMETIALKHVRLFNETLIV